MQGGHQLAQIEMSVGFPDTMRDPSVIGFPSRVFNGTPARLVIERPFVAARSCAAAGEAIARDRPSDHANVVPNRIFTPTPPAAKFLEPNRSRVLPAARIDAVAA
ncbi:hypothetical protein SAQ01S_05200 [Sphingomonas aquatilis NBRC 16722]|nr:hypothetical protein SAQ01S_05200 [Sphingomonas aquatilis NBRC 16722]